MKRWLVSCILLALGCAVLAACGSSYSQGSNNWSSTPGGSQNSSPQSSSSSMPDTSSSVQNSSSGDQTVHILEGEMYVKSDVINFKVGTLYHFVVKNAGNILHNFVIARKVPGSNQDGRNTAAIKETDNIQPGQTTAFDLTFKEPSPTEGMEFECGYPGHYEMGMHMDIIVK
jgi:uncharacterized cupredoxin-like copper-binding protein